MHRDQTGNAGSDAPQAHSLEFRRRLIHDDGSEIRLEQVLHHTAHGVQAWRVVTRRILEVDAVRLAENAVIACINTLWMSVNPSLLQSR
jgi:hypothetical protein